MNETHFPEGTSQGDYLIAEAGAASRYVKVVAEGNRASWLFPNQVGKTLMKEDCFRVVQGPRNIWFVQPIDPGKMTKPVMPEFVQTLRDEAVIVLAWGFLTSNGVKGPQIGSPYFEQMFGDGYFTTSNILRVVNDLLTMSEIELRENGQYELADFASSSYMDSVRQALESRTQNGWCHPDGCPYRDARRGDLPFPSPMPQCNICGKKADHGVSEKDFRNSK